MTLGYLAGLIDGEGSIGIARNHAIWLVIVSTDPRLVEWLRSTIGGSISCTERKDHPNWKPRLAWSVHAKQAEALLKVIAPHLIIKKQQAELAIACRALGKHRWKGRKMDPVLSEAREDMRQRMKLLNRRGVAA